MNTDTGDANQVALYTTTAAALAELRQRLAAVVYDVSTTKGLDAAKRDRRELVTLRTSLEAERKRIKEPALEFTRRIDSEAKRLTAEIVALEEPIDAQIKREEERREAEKRAREEAERKRIATIQAAIDTYRRAVAEATGLSSAEIAAVRNQLAATRFDEVWPAQFAEFADEAKAARDSAVIALADLQDRVMRQEAEAKRIAEERAELEELRRLQAERAAREAEECAAREAQERAAREAEERRLAAAREQAEAQARAEREAAEREAAAARAAEEDRLRAEAERLAAERAEFDEFVARTRRAHIQAMEEGRQLREEEVASQHERLEEAEAATRRARQAALADAGLTAPIFELLRRCEEFVSIFEHDGPPEAPELLADLRVALGMDEPAKVAA